MTKLCEHLKRHNDIKQAMPSSVGLVLWAFTHTLHQVIYVTHTSTKVRN